MILTCGGIKGGVGKTTIATNFACIAAGQGSKVLLVDADDQENRIRLYGSPKSGSSGFATIYMHSANWEECPHLRY